MSSSSTCLKVAGAMDALNTPIIIIAEDDDDLGRLLEIALKNAGYTAVRAGSGEETLQLCQQHSPSNTFLLLDYNLGDMDAKEVVSELKSRNQHFPFIIMTGYGSERLAVEMMKLGAEDYILKGRQAIELLLQTLSQMFERKRTQRALSKTQEALDTAYQAITAADNGIVIARVQPQEYPIVYANPAFEKITGCQHTSTSTLKDWLSAYSQQEQTGLRQLRSALETHQPVYALLSHNANPAPCWHQVNLSFAQKETGEEIIIGILIDTTKEYLKDRKIEELREQLDQIQRLAVAGQIAKELAHEVGHPLTLISSRIQSISVSNSAEKQAFSAILSHIDRITHLLRRFSSDSMDTIAPSFFDAASVIQTVLELSPQQDSITIDTEYKEDMPRLYADKAKIIQILLNLLINAIEACNGNGQIVIATDRHFNADGEQYAAISVQDTGVGIAPEHRSRIFEPFFSTKGDTRSRGLGLPICQSIAYQHGGWIDVQSTLNKGTKFTLMLPMKPATAAPIQTMGDYQQTKVNTVTAIRENHGHHSVN